MMGDLGSDLCSAMTLLIVNSLSFSLMLVKIEWDDPVNIKAEM